MLGISTSEQTDCIGPYRKGVGLRAYASRSPSSYDPPVLNDSAFAHTLWDYEPNLDPSLEQETADFLPFRAGRVVRVLERDSSGWWWGEMDGQQGLFPCDHVEDGDDGDEQEDYMMTTSHGALRSTPVEQPLEEIDQYCPSVLAPFVQALFQLQLAAGKNLAKQFQFLTANIVICANSILASTRIISQPNSDYEVSSLPAPMANKREQVLSAIDALLEQTTNAANVTIRYPEGHSENTGQRDIMLYRGHQAFVALRSFVSLAMEYGVKLPEEHWPGLYPAQYRVWTSYDVESWPSEEYPPYPPDSFLPTQTESSASARWNPQEIHRMPTARPPSFESTDPLSSSGSSYLAAITRIDQGLENVSLRSQALDSPPALYGIRATNSPPLSISMKLRTTSSNADRASRLRRLRLIAEESEDEDWDGEDDEEDEANDEDGDERLGDGEEDEDLEGGEEPLLYNLAAAALADRSSSRTYSTASSGASWTDYGSVYLVRRLTMSSLDS